MLILHVADYTTPMYNDSVLYRDCYAYHSNVSNTYTSNLYDNREGIPIRNHTGSRYGTRNPYYDPYSVRSITNISYPNSKSNFFFNFLASTIGFKNEC